MARRRGQGEGTIVRRSDERYEVRISVNGRQKTVAYAKTSAEARAKLTEALRGQDQGMPLVQGSATLADFTARWLDTIAASVRPGTRKRYAELLTCHVLPDLGRVRLAKLTPEQVQHLYATIQARGLSSSTAHRVHSVLHKLLKDAMRLGLVAVNVADAVTAPRDAKRDMQVWTPEQARAFLDTTAGHRLESLFVLALFTGMRIGEVLALRWTDVDLKGATITVRASVQRRTGGAWEWSAPKTKSGRRLIHVAPTVVEALQAHRIRQAEERPRAGPLWQDTGLVFCDEVGAPLTADHVRRTHFYALVRRAGVPAIRFHDLRHTAATLLLLQGVPVKVVSHDLGHSTTVITSDLYQHVLPDMQRLAAAAMEGVLRRQPSGS